MISDRFASSAGEWLNSSGPENDIVLSTRVRLARNIHGYKMPWKMSLSERRDMVAYLKERISEAGIVESSRFFSVGSLEENDRQVLVERHLISPELAVAQGERAVIFSDKESISIMLNEEDHLRIQVILAGFRLEESWKLMSAIDTLIENTVPYAFSLRLGYLTACPTNVGTGMRLSVMSHLPTLVQTRQIEKVHRAAGKCGLILRGLYGEGTPALGDFFQISNQVTLGRSEEDILGTVQRLVAKIVEWERGVRQLLMSQDRMGLEDRVWRAYGQLRMARRISSEEAMEHLSTMRLGISLNILRDINMQAVNELFLFTQPAHLQALRGEVLVADDRDRVRAKFIRDRLNSDIN